MTCLSCPVIAESQEKVLKEHHHVGVPIPPGQPVSPVRASTSSKTQPIQEFESSLSHMPLPWGGHTAPPAVLQDDILHQAASASPMLGPPDLVQEPAAAIAVPQEEQAAPEQEPDAAAEPPASAPEEPQAEAAADQQADSTMEEAQAEVPSMPEAEAPAVAEAPAPAAVAAPPKDETEPAPLVEASPPEEQPEASAAPAESQPAEPIDEAMVQEDPAAAPVPETAEDEGRDADAVEEEQMASEAAAPLPDAPKEDEVMAVEVEEDMMEQAQLSAEDGFDKGPVEAGGEQGDKLGMNANTMKVMEDEVMSNFSSNADDCTDLMVAPIDDVSMVMLLYCMILPDIFRVGFRV